MKKIIIVLSFIFCFNSCEYITEVQDISNQKILVLAPQNQTIINSNEVIFTWTDLEDAEQYKLQIAQPNFAEAVQIIEDSILSTTSFSKTLQPGAYQWRLRAENSEYQTAYEVFDFVVDAGTIIDISNAVLVLLAPNENSTFSSSEAINFSWEAIEGALNYSFQIATPGFDSPTETIENQTLTGTNFSVSSLAEGNYQWRVKAENLIYETNYTTRNFIIESN